MQKNVFQLLIRVISIFQTLKITRTLKMIRKLFSRSQILYPDFRNLTPQAMPASLLNGLASNMYYTPKIQKIMYSDQLVKYLAFLTRKKTIYPADMKNLTENFLTEYGNVYKNAGLHEQKFGFQKGYRIQKDGDCPYHGNVDYMIYLNQTHFFPLMFFQNDLNPYCGAALAMSNMFMKAKLRQQQKTSGYSIITNGQEWRMFKIYRDMTLQKSLAYQGKTTRLRNIYEDYQMVSVILGLFDFCLDINRPDVDTLKLAYDFIDEQRFQLEAKQDEKINNSPASKILKKVYENKKDWNSK